MKKVNLFLIGNQKSGSTALAEYLDQHPRICLSKPKATNYFDRTFEKSYKVTTEEAYMKAFSNMKANYLCDASDSYHVDINTLKRIFAYNPDSKILVILRNPFSMLKSLHEHVLWAGYEDIEDINDAWSAYQEREAGFGVPAGCPSISYLNYSSNCSIGSQLKNLYSIFPDENIYVCQSEDLRHDRLSVLNGIFDFLDLPGLDYIEEVNANEAVREKSRTLTLINRKIPVQVKMYLKNIFLKFGINLDGSFRKLNGAKASGEQVVEFDSQIISFLNNEINIVEVLTGLDLEVWRRRG